MKPFAILACATAALALVGCNKKQGENATTNANVTYAHTTPPPGGDWTGVINPTPDGGVMMGDPNAKVHLIEIGSLTCPHCREFEETAVDQLVAKYVKTGKVSYEFRNYIRNLFDLSAVLIAKCNGPEGFFPLSRAFYDTQLDWEGKLQKNSAGSTRGAPEPAREPDRAGSREDRRLPRLGCGARRLERQGDPMPDRHQEDRRDRQSERSDCEPVAGFLRHSEFRDQRHAR